MAESRLEFVDDDTQAVTALVRSDFSGYTTEGRIVVMGDQERGSLLRVLNDGFYYFPEFRQRPGGGEVGEEDLLRSTEGSRLAAILFRLRVGTRSQRSLFDRIQKSFTSLFSNLELQVVKVRNQPTIVISRQNSEYELPLSEVGAGIFEMVLILTHTVGEESRVFILDEPELHLHPHSQRLLEELLKASSSRNQLILATHSPQSNKILSYVFESFRFKRFFVMSTLPLPNLTDYVNRGLSHLMIRLVDRGFAVVYRVLPNYFSSSPPYRTKRLGIVRASMPSEPLWKVYEERRALIMDERYGEYEKKLAEPSEEKGEAKSKLSRADEILEQMKGNPVPYLDENGKMDYRKLMSAFNCSSNVAYTVIDKFKNLPGKSTL